MADFAPALAKTLIHEGGYSNNPHDHGGSTNKGITQKTYDLWQDHVGQPQRNVKGISDSEISDIYYHFYWKPSRCEELIAQPVAEKVFDLCVNCGLKAATRILQQACNDSGHLISVDGLLGDLTLGAANVCNPHDLMDALRVRAKRHYMAIVQRDPSQSVFINGWLARAES